VRVTHVPFFQTKSFGPRLATMTMPGRLDTLGEGSIEPGPGHQFRASWAGRGTVPAQVKAS
jgi:hypothetical protein